MVILADRHPFKKTLKNLSFQCNSSFGFETETDSKGYEKFQQNTCIYYHKPKITESMNCKPELQILPSVWWLPQNVSSEAIKFLSTWLDGDKFSTKIMTQQPPVLLFAETFSHIISSCNKGQIKIILFFSNLLTF